MANTLRIKRRSTGLAGAPATLANAELAFNEIDNTLYYGKGDSSGVATSVIAIGGDGAVVMLTGNQSIDGTKTFTAAIAADITGNAANVTGVVAVVNGGTGANNAAGALTNLGATTVGSNLVGLTNPSAITFPRINADNTVDALSAVDFFTAIGGVADTSVWPVPNTTGASGPTTIGIGLNAQATTPGDAAIAIGGTAGQTSQGDNAVAIGDSAGNSTQGLYAVALGSSAGQTSQGASAIAIGAAAGGNTQGANSVAIGASAAGNSQAANSIAIGGDAGFASQATGAVSIGTKAGETRQGAYGVAIGDWAGISLQHTDAVAVGSQAGGYSQGAGATAVGAAAGSSSQGTNSVAIGVGAGGGDYVETTFVSFTGTNLEVAGTAGVAVGYTVSGVGITAGQTVVAVVNGTNVTLSAAPDGSPVGPVVFTRGIGTNSVMIGAEAGRLSVDANVIVINATGVAVNGVPGVSNALYIDPVRSASATASALYYNTTTKEVTYGDATAGAVTVVSVATANGFAGTVATDTTTPVITIATSVTGLLKGNGTAISAATEGTDYLAPFASQTANNVFAAPNGSAGTPSFRALAAADIPSLTAAKISDFDTQVQTNRLDQLSAPTGAVSFNSQKITGLATPTASTDAANKSYVDSVAQGLDPKESCLVASTANITTLSGLISVDGVTVGEGDRVLVKNQTLAKNNGIYIASASAWARATDFDSWLELPSAFTFVETGALNGDTGWVCTSDAGGTLETTAITFVQFSGAGTYTDGDGLTLTGNTFAVGATTDRISVTAGAVDIASTYVGQTSLTTLGTITTGTWDATTVAVTAGGTGLETATTSGIVYGNGTSALGVTAAGTWDGTNGVGQILSVNSSGVPTWTNTVDGGAF